MPLHQSGLVSRQGLQHPEQPKPRVMPSAPPFELVLKAGGPGYNPYRAKSGLFASAGASEGFQPKDQMRIANLAKEGPKMQARAAQMAKSITDLRKAYRRANAAEAAGHKDVAKIFRARAKQISTPSGGGGSATAHSAEAQQAKSHLHGASDGGTGQAVSVAAGLPASWQKLVTHATATSALAAEAKAPATPMHPADKAKLEAIAASPAAAATPLGGPYRSRITPTPENAEARGKLQSYMDGFSKGLKNESERAYAQERIRQMISGENRPSGMSGKFGLSKQRAVQYEALVYKIFQAGRKKLEM